MTKKQKARLIKALRIRQEQFNANESNERLKYKIHEGHHRRDIATVLAVLEGKKSADSLLDTMPKKEDLPWLEEGDEVASFAVSWREEK